MPGTSRVSEDVILSNGAEIMLSPDGQIVVIQYAVGDKKITIGLPFEDTRDLLSRMTQVVSVTPDGSGYVRMTPVTAASANPTDIPEHFSLTLYDDMKLPHYYAFPAELSAQLRPALRSAEAATKRGVKMGRA